MQQEFDPRNLEAWRIFGILRSTTGISEGLDYKALELLFDMYGVRRKQETFEKIMVCLNEAIRVRDQSKNKFDMTNKVKGQLRGRRG